MDAEDDPALAETQSPALAARPMGDTRARDVARAKIANALFAKKEIVKLGRYHVLERVGAGGMGVVWGAWDPELDRRVAIKVLHAQATATRERLLVEGQALAKLSHPNVVAVHDVGLVDDQVYLVMEWIRGRNLRLWCKEARSVREIVEIYRGAAEGLQAAHRAGLIHRDFKPENVMVGDDGRVRVLDFGLAVSESGDGAHVAGTPRYMPEEQVRGDTLTPAVDQYAFCVALREALVERNGDGKHAEVPAWLESITDRGTAREPAQRFSSMEELIRGLGRDPAHIWRRRLLVAGAIGAAGAAFAIGSWRAGSGEVAPCTGAPDEIASAWNPAKRDAMLVHARGLGPYGGDEAARLDAHLGAYSQRWIAAHRGACLAHRRGELTPGLYERGLACFARARVALGTVVEVMSRTPIERFPDALVASRSLPDVGRCTIEETAVMPPSAAIAGQVDETSNRIASASVLALAADPQAHVVASEAATEADRLQYAPVIARAQLVLGRALFLDPSRLPDTLLAFDRSASAALEAGDVITFVEAFARALFVYSRTPKDLVPATLASLPASLRYVQEIAKRTRETGAFARALLYNNAGTERFTSGDVETARRWYREAYRETQAGARDIELWSIVGNLASTVESREERERLFDELRAHLERELGANHAFTLQERFRAAMFTEHGERAAQQLRELCATLATWYPHRKDKLDQCFYELGWLAEERGDRAEARSAMASVGGSGDERVALGRAFSTLYAGDLAGAARAASHLATEASRRPAWWQQFHAIDAWLVEATARIALGDRDRARDGLERASALLDQPSFNRSATFYQRRLARVRALLATVVDAKRAREVAERALAWYREAGGYDASVASLEAMLTGSGSGSR